jgi:hypothetical protein
MNTGVGNVSGSSIWIQISENDFNQGTLHNLQAPIDGDLKLGFRRDMVFDEYYNTSKIAQKSNLDLLQNKGILQLSEFNETFGGISADMGNSIIETSGNNYLIVGNNGNSAWLLKIDNLGNEVWNKTFGSSFRNWFSTIRPTNDGGYILSGTKAYSPYNNNQGDAWIMKIDYNGNEQWNRTLGGRKHDFGTFCNQTRDGGFIFIGYTKSYGAGDFDCWIVKTNSTGIEQWNKTYGGVDSDAAFMAQQTPDGGYIVTAQTLSFGSGNYDAWIFKINSTGTNQWERIKGGTLNDGLTRIQPTSDGNYVLIGGTWSFGTQENDVWLVKMNDKGDELLNLTYVGPDRDMGTHICETSDQGFIIVGVTRPPGTSIQNTWLIKTNKTGVLEWDRIYGGRWDDECYWVQQTSDGGYIVVGLTESFGVGYTDVWVFKTDATGNIHPDGNMRSGNLLSGCDTSTIELFECNTTVDPKAVIRIQFSQDQVNWYNSLGVMGDWDYLLDGDNCINLSALSWSGCHFYYRAEFSADCNCGILPALDNVNITYSQYLESGTYESPAFDTISDIAWVSWDWDIVTPPGTKIIMQVKTAELYNDLASMIFKGPDGKSNTFYLTPGTQIKFDSNQEHWIMYKLYFSTTNQSVTPVLNYISFEYNLLPKRPILMGPINGAVTNNNKPEFKWEFQDSDTENQGAFQWLVDNDINFDSIDYDSSEQSTIKTVYTPKESLADGDWVWCVRTMDEGGAWGGYSSPWRLTVDTWIATPTHLSAAPLSWSSEDSFTLYWINPDDLTGISGVHYQFDEDPLASENSTYLAGDDINQITNLQLQTDGEHRVYIWLQDAAGNIDVTKSNYTILKLDTTPPLIDHKELTNVTEGRGIEFTADVIDESSGVKEVLLYLKNEGDSFYSEFDMVNDEGTYYVQLLPHAITGKSFSYYLKAIDNSRPENIVYFGRDGELLQEPKDGSDIEVEVKEKEIQVWRFPRVIDFQPRGSNVSVNESILITFNGTMDKSTTASAFSISPTISGNLYWVENTLQFIPDQVLDYNTTYRVIISKEAANIEGLTLNEEFNWTFQTTKYINETGHPKPPRSETHENLFGLSSLVWGIFIMVLIIIITIIIVVLLLLRKRRRDSWYGAGRYEEDQDDYLEYPSRPYRSPTTHSSRGRRGPQRPQEHLETWDARDRPRPRRSRSVPPPPGARPRQDRYKRRPKRPELKRDVDDDSDEDDVDLDSLDIDWEEPEEQAITPEESNMVECKFCHKFISSNICPHCGWKRSKI